VKQQVSAACQPPALQDAASSDIVVASHCGSSSAGLSVAGSVAAQSVARFDGSHWSAVGALDGAVYALVVFDDGGGPALYATGAFMTAAGTTVDHIARWDGSGWSPLAGGGLSSVSNDETPGKTSTCRPRSGAARAISVVG